MEMFRGNTVMSGYLKDSKATEDAFSGGWFHSGDLSVKHPDGYIELKDRCKDVIISGGENISTIEVETVLYNHPAVYESAVIARPDDHWGELRVKLIKFRWKKFAFVIGPGEIKLFCDGSSMGNPGPEGCGSVFRDHDGGVIGVFSMNLSAFKDLEIGAISNHRRLVSGFGAGVLEFIRICFSEMWDVSEVILIYALRYGTVNELNSAKKSCGLENWHADCMFTSSATLSSEFREDQSVNTSESKLLGIASIPLDEQTEARSTINGLKPLKKLGYGVIMGFGSSSTSEALNKAYPASQMMQMIILLITGTNKDEGNAGELLDSSDKAQTLNVKTKRLFVTGLSFYTSEKTLRAAFEGFVKIIMDKISKRSKGYAFLEYTTEKAAGAALKEMNDKIINGWMIVVDVAKTNPPKYNKDSLKKPTV
ncbi:hypothetical protein GIB67_002033 [Kingdonia uniflora]|uniref:RRM domain-containing protein n=1 Tax=Kingdonia uniflora TaxID=39325 RepID=A0A7J7MAF2_9MAGN|nr:hypothetical protein GIB67_002033 [Kingdonia uniflora]